ncbi:MAG: hypothetical protein AB1679_00400 [Actinomycetota bacterium]
MDSNDTFRQRWIAKIVPVVQELGFHLSPDLVRYDEESGEWVYAPPDWAEVKNIINDGGPHYKDWVESIQQSLTRNERYRQGSAGGLT